MVKEKIWKFDTIEIQHVLHEHNARVGILSKLARTKTKRGNKSAMQEILTTSGIKKNKAIHDINVTPTENWTTPIKLHISTF